MTNWVLQLFNATTVTLGCGKQAVHLSNALTKKKFMQVHRFLFTIKFYREGLLLSLYYMLYLLISIQMDYIGMGKGCK